MTTTLSKKPELRFRVKHFKETASTNTLAREYAETGVKEGLVISTDFQTEGRGKQGAKWFSPAGKDLLFSVILRPPVAPSRAPLLTQIACQSVARALREVGVEADVKRPNDLMVGGKKICGVLTEAVTTQKNLECVIIGIGLNVNSEDEELIPTATSVKVLTGKKTGRTALLKSLLAELKKDIEGFYGLRS